jgi:dolichyl-phosphate-mannose-protein mannosyltransferase
LLRSISRSYLANMLPFALITRGMFIYHYFPALIAAILAIGLLINRSRWSVFLGVCAITVALPSFVYFAPLTYGLPLTDLGFKSRMWLEGWR